MVEMWVEDEICIIKAFMFACLKISRRFRSVKSIFDNNFPYMNICRSQISETNRSPAVLSCGFDNFNLRFLQGMMFNHWEPNLFLECVESFYVLLLRLKKWVQLLNERKKRTSHLWLPGNGLYKISNPFTQK